MDKTFIRSEMLIGKENIAKLKTARVAVFGVGGVGGICVEALVRSGVGNITVIDSDTVDQSNINRQIIATQNSVGSLKTQVVKERLLSINPNANVQTYNLFYLPESANQIDFSSYDYVVDAVDTVSAKLEIIKRAKEQGVKVISCMGTGGKLDPTLLKITTIDKTEGCPLARVMRRELKALGIFDVKVVFSTEKAITSRESQEEEKKGDGKKAPPSMIFVPSVAGLLLAKEVVLDLIKE